MRTLLSVLLLAGLLVTPGAFAYALSPPPDPDPSTFTLEVSGDFETFESVNGSTPVVEVVDDYVVEQTGTTSSVTEDPDGEWSIRVDVKETVTGDYYDGWVYLYRNRDYTYVLTDNTQEGSPTSLGSESIAASYSGSLTDGSLDGTSYVPASDVVVDAGALESEALLAATDLAREDVEGVITGLVTAGEANQAGVYDDDYDYGDDLFFDDYDYDDDYYDYNYDDTWSSGLNEDEIAGIVGGIAILTFGILAIVFFAVFMPLVLGMVFIALVVWMIVRAFRSDGRGKKSGATPRPKA